MQTPPASWIRWPGYLAWLFLLMLPLAVLTVRSGQWQQGLLLYAISCLLSLALLGYFGILAVIPKLAAQRRGLLLRAVPAVPGSLLLALSLPSGDVPPIHDITTDTDNPPVFETVVSLRGDRANSLDIDPAVIELQRAAYPELETLRSDQSFATVYAAALQAARDMGWEIVRDDANAGFIEAVAETPIMNFTDDIVVRVSTDAAGTHVDLRSASRVGVSDLGANAARIRAYLELLRGSLGAA